MLKNNNHGLNSIFELEIKNPKKTKKFFGIGGDNEDQRTALINMVMEIYNNELTKKQHDAFDYVYFKNMTVTQAAENMGITESSCSKLLKRGRERINRMLSYGYFPVWKSTT